MESDPNSKRKDGDTCSTEDRDGPVRPSGAPVLGGRWGIGISPRPRTDKRLLEFNGEIVRGFFDSFREDLSGSRFGLLY